MQYFKHFANASDSRTINHLFDEFGHAGYAGWFLLLELCSEKFDGKSEPKFSFHTRIVRQKLRFSRKKLELFLEKCSEKGSLTFQLSEKELHLHIPKLLEVKTSRTLTKNSKNQLTVYREKDKELDINIDKEKETESTLKPNVDSGYGALPEFSENKALRELLETIPVHVQIRWFHAYDFDCEFIEKSLVKAGEWIIKKQNRPLNLEDFLSRWLERARDFEGTSETGSDPEKIKSLVSKGFTRIDDCKPALNEYEKKWITDNGGLLALGRLSMFEFERLLKTLKIS